MKVILKRAIKRKKDWLYYIDADGNLCGYYMREAVKFRNRFNKQMKLIQKQRRLRERLNQARDKE